MRKIFVVVGLVILTVVLAPTLFQSNNVEANDVFRVEGIVKSIEGNFDWTKFSLHLEVKQSENDDVAPLNHVVSIASPDYTLKGLLKNEYISINCTVREIRYTHAEFNFFKDELVCFLKKIGRE